MGASIISRGNICTDGTVQMSTGSNMTNAVKINEHFIAQFCSIIIRPFHNVTSDIGIVAFEITSF